VLLTVLIALVLGLMPVGVAAADTEPRGTGNVCDPPFVSAFVDIAGSAHEANVLCMADYGLTQGTGDGTTYSPRRAVTRAQMATFVARWIEHYGQTTLGDPGYVLPVSPARFDDIPDGFVHDENIHKLAAIGVTQGITVSSFGPQQSVTRGQMATFISRAASYLETGQATPASQPPRTPHDLFPDDDGSVHEANINALASVGIVAGYSDGTYRPGAPVLRDQMATFVMRTYDWAAFVGLGVPEPGTIAGIVSDATRQHPIAGATVTVSGTVYAATTQGDGRYEITDVTPGTYTVNVTATGYDPGTRAGVVVAPEAVTVVDFDLTPRAIDPGEDAGTIAGIVSDATSQHPIAGATVTVSGTAYAATTGADGRYEITDVTPSTYTLTVTATGYDPATRAGVVVTADEVTVVDLDLAPSAQVFDHELTVRLNWQNQYREIEGRFGGVDDYAAYHLDPNGAGQATFRWDDGPDTVVVEGETTLTARATTFTLHEGALDEEAPVALTLTAPSFLGESSDPPTADDRGVYRYSLGGTVADAALVAALDEAVTGNGLAGWYVSVQSTLNPDGEVRGQLGSASVTDGGLAGIVPIYRFVEFHELGEGTNTGEEQTSFNLLFDSWIDFAGVTGKERPQPEDFVMTRQRGADTEELEILRVRGNNPDWQPYPKPDIRLHLDTHDVIEDGDIVTVELLDSGAAKLLPYGRNATADDVTDSWRTRCTHVISVLAMTSEPCGTPPQAGLSDYEVTAIESAPHRAQQFTVTIEEPGLPAGDELWIDLIDVSHDGLVDYGESTWTATVDGVEVGTAEFWEYEEVERFQTVWEPFLGFSHTDANPVAGELVLSGTGIDGSDAAVHGEDTSYDTYVVRHDTGRADYTEIEVKHVPQPTITLEPADAVVLAESGASLAVTATYTDVDDVPVDGAELRLWAEQGERPNIVEVPLGTATTVGDGTATVTYTYDGRAVALGDPLIDTLRAELLEDRFVDARTTVSWATGVATNESSGATFHDLNDAVVEAEVGDTITAVGAFTSVYGLPRGDRVSVRTANLTLQAGPAGASLRGAFDVRASGVTVAGFDVEHGGSMEYAFRVEGAGITISDNVIDANGADGFRVRDAWRAVAGRSATISGNVIRGAAIAIDVDNRDQVPDLIVDLTIEDNLFEDNEVGIHYNADGGTPSITGNRFEADGDSNVYVRDATAAEVLDLDASLAGNDYDPEGEILGRSIVPIDPTHVPSMVRVVEHGAGTGNMYSVVEYTRGVACDGNEAEVGSQFGLDRGEAQTPNRVGVDVECGYDGNPSLIKIEWDGNPSFPNAITYTEHATATYRIRNEHALDGGGFTDALSPQTIGSPFPKPVDEAPVYGAVYLDLGAATIDGRWFTQGQEVFPVGLRVSIANRSEVPEGGLSLWFEGARPDEEGFIPGETICEELFTEVSCTTIMNAFVDNDRFTDNTQFLTDATLQVSSDAALGVWQLRFWVVGAGTNQPFFSDTFAIEIIAPRE
jgi:hypothetical protein